MSVDKNGVEETIVSFDNSQVGPLFYDHRDQWVRLSFGVIRLPTACNMKIRIFGENSTSPVSDIFFGEFRLTPHHISWEKEKLLLLSYRRKNRDEVHEPCYLQRLPLEVQRLIGRFLIPSSAGDN